MLVLQIKERIRSQAAIDVDPPLSAAAQYMRQDMTREGYRHLLAVGARGSSFAKQRCLAFGSFHADWTCPCR